MLDFFKGVIEVSDQKTVEVPNEIPAPPLLPMIPGKTPLQGIVYKGRLIGSTLYCPETQSGGLFIHGQGIWIVWGPATPGRVSGIRRRDAAYPCRAVRRGAREGELRTGRH
jgi:hypothetical protein